MRRLSTYDAVIIGAGPAGSSAALTLARRGWAVAIVEKSAFPRRKVCG
ncbi:FAD-dependent oxidoreductase, partial [Mesorhizobium sp. 10.2.3]